MSQLKTYRSRETVRATAWDGQADTADTIFGVGNWNFREEGSTEVVYIHPVNGPTAVPVGNIIVVGADDVVTSYSPESFAALYSEEVAA